MASRVAGGAACHHESASLHASGEALYTDDIPLPGDTLHAAFGIATIAHGRVTRMDLAPARASPGVVAVLTAADIPGKNNYGPILADDPILSPGEVLYAGQPL